MKPTRYEICVRGQLTERLGSAFDGMTLRPDTTKTTLVGGIQDQSHLYGVLDQVRNLGLDLISVQPAPTAEPPGAMTASG